MKSVYGVCGSCSEIKEIVDWNGQVLDAEGGQWVSPGPSTGVIASGLPEYRLVEHKKFVGEIDIRCEGSWATPWSLIGEEEL